jgi:hypothetical protein
MKLMDLLGTLIGESTSNKSTTDINVSDSICETDSIVVDGVMDPEKNDIVMYNSSTLESNLFMGDIIKPQDNTPWEFSPELLQLVETVKTKTVIVCSTQTPYNGGSSTNAYNIYKLLKSLNVTCAAFFSINEYSFVDDTKNTLLVDPEGVGGVFALPRFNKKTIGSSSKKELVERVDQISKTIIDYLGGPVDICLCKNYSTPVMCRYMFKKANVVYLVSGSRSLTDIIQKKKISVNHILSTKMHLEKIGQEIDALEVSDHVTCNSLLSHKVMTYTYPEFEGKFTEPLLTSDVSGCYIKRKVDDSKILNQEDRKIDILYAISNLERNIKGPDMCCEIMNHPRLKGLTKVVIGRNTNLFPFNEDIITFDHMDNLKLLKFMNNAKVSILTSYYEACPNYGIESNILKCHTFISTNIGGNERWDPQYVVQKRENIDEWVDKISDKLSNTTQCDFSLPVMEIQDNIIKYLLSFKSSQIVLSEEFIISQKPCIFNVTYNKYKLLMDNELYTGSEFGDLDLCVVNDTSSEYMDEIDEKNKPQLVKYKQRFLPIIESTFDPRRCILFSELIPLLTSCTCSNTDILVITDTNYTKLKQKKKKVILAEDIDLINLCMTHDIVCVDFSKETNDFELQYKLKEHGINTINISRFSHPL